MDKTLAGTVAVMDNAGEIESLSGQGWAVVAGLPNWSVQRDYFDLSGYQLEDLSVFFQGVEMQEPTPVLGNGQSPSVVEIISTEFISDAEIVAAFTTVPLGGSGFSTSTNNMEQIVYGRRRIYYQKEPLVSPVIPFLHSVSSWGTCAATTADKLHITRILHLTSIDSTTYLGDVNVVVAIIVDKEATLPFLMRQKRSYELATGP